MIRALLELCRISNLPTVWTNVLAAWIFVSWGDIKHRELLWLLIGGSLVYSAGMILNDACDAAWDREKRRERPIPSGRISLPAAWVLAIGGLLGGAVMMVLGGGAGETSTALLVAAIVAYDVYHKPWAGSVIVMGLCRTFLYLAAGGAVLAGSCKSEAIWFLLTLGGVVLGSYIVGLTLTARAEGKGSVGGMRGWLTGLMMLPVAGAVFMGLIFFKTWLGDDNHPRGTVHLLPVIGLLMPVLAFIFWTRHALGEMRKGGPAIGAAVGFLLAGIPLVDAIFIGIAWPQMALVFCGLPPLLRYWQRWVAAT